MIEYNKEKNFTCIERNQIKNQNQIRESTVCELKLKNKYTSLVDQKKRRREDFEYQ